jgi:hypothetical protein
MLAKVAGRLCITHIKITTDHTAVSLSFAMFGPAFEDMNTAFINIFNGRSSLKENINR